MLGSTGLLHHASDSALETSALIPGALVIHCAGMDKSLRGDFQSDQRELGAQLPMKFH